MKLRHLIMTAMLAAGLANSQTTPVSEKAQARIAKEARHEILMLPYFDVSDNNGVHRAFSVTNTLRVES